MTLCTFTHWPFNLMLARSKPYMIDSLGGYGIYFICGACLRTSYFSARNAMSDKCGAGDGRCDFGELLHAGNAGYDA